MGVPELLRRARQARLAQDGPAVLEALGEAASLACQGSDEGLILTTGWRLAKAAHDFGTPDQVLEALRLVLSREAPFAHYPQATSAAEPLARRIWDTKGYGEPEVLELWRAYSAHQRSMGDPWLEAQGAVQRAWHLACRGALPELRVLTEPWLRLTPARFGRGPSKHPDAEATTLSLYWVHADLARIHLRAATWAGDPAAAREARDLLLDALAIVERPLGRCPWEVDALCRAGDRFGWTDAPWTSWLRVLETWESEHPVHAALGRAVLDRRSRRAGAATAFLAAADLAERTAAGWEWVVDALVEAERIAPDPALAERIASVRQRRSVGVG